MESGVMGTFVTHGTYLDHNHRGVIWVYGANLFVIGKVNHDLISLAYFHAVVRECRCYKISHSSYCQGKSHPEKVRIHEDYHGSIQFKFESVKVSQIP